MTTFFILWKMNTNIMPGYTMTDPKIALKINEAFLALMNSQLQSGVVKELHSFLQGDRGYGITGDVTDEQLAEAISAWMPFITFEVHKTIPATKDLEIAISRIKKLMGPS
jgi:hypothetical protein